MSRLFEVDPRRLDQSSEATTRASGRRALMARAMAPVPVPTSTTTGLDTAAMHARATSATPSVSGRGTKTPGRTVRVSAMNCCSPVRC